jgi:hypothetical protein
MPNFSRRGSRAVRRSSTAAPTWQLAGVAMALLMGAFFIGIIVQSGRDNADRQNKEAELATLAVNQRNADVGKDRLISDLTIEHTELLQRFDALNAKLGSSLVDKERFAGEHEFLEWYVAYLKSPNATGNQHLVDSVCSLWKNSDKRSIKIERQPLLLSAADIKQGRLTPELQTLLVENFVSLEPIMKIRLGETGGATPISASGKSGLHQSATANPSLADPQIPPSTEKQIQDIRIVKFIIFPDGTRYELPQAVAVAVQIRRECALG